MRLSCAPALDGTYKRHQYMVPPPVSLSPSSSSAAFRSFVVLVFLPFLASISTGSPLPAGTYYSTHSYSCSRDPSGSGSKGGN